MKRKIGITVAALAISTSIASASVQQHTWYTGTKVGWSQYYDTGYLGNGYINNDGLTSQHHSAISTIFGYQVNPHVGFELGYDWLGRMQTKGKVTGNFKSYGIQLTSKINYQITDKFDIYTRLGGMLLKSEAIQNNPIFGQIKDFKNGLSPVGAIGIEYALSNKIATRLEYQWINEIGDSHVLGLHPNNNLFSLGFTYSVMHKMLKPEETSLLSIPSSSQPIVKNNNFGIKNEVLFNFDKYDLTLLSKKNLDQLYSTIQSVGSNNISSVIIVGYADQIGNTIHNKILSYKRALSVAKYLMSKGLDSNKISVWGEGSKSSVTKNNCKFLNSRSILIHCLGPDRRVEIQVKGINY
ncbi:MAG: porin OmpA [Candidatus Dasytiphilus stammeri]